MIQVSNSTAQTLLPGQTLTFDRVLAKSGRCQCFNRQLPSSIKLCAKGNYSVTFSGNITGSAAAANLQLSLALEGTPIPTGLMNAVPAAAGDLVNVSRTTTVSKCCCDVGRISVINSGTDPITVAPNASLIVRDSCN